MMRTWSIESAFARAYTAVVDKLSTLEGLTRPPRRGHGVDAVDGAEQLAEREAEEEVHDPRDPLTQEMRDAGWEFTPLHEPALSDDELVAVRGLIQKRYEDGRPKWLRDLLTANHEIVNDMLSGDEVPSCGHTYCEKHGYGLCFGAAGAIHDFAGAAAKSSADPLQPGVYGDARTADDSGEELSGHSPRSSSSPRPTWSDLADRMANHLPSAKAEDECRARHRSYCCTRPAGHEGKHGQAGVFWWGAGDGLVAQFDTFITKWVDPAHHGHLLDNDTNDGERMRQAIRDALGSDLATAMVRHHSSATATGQLTASELFAAADCVDNWSASDNCDDNPYTQSRLRELATRLRDAAHALRNQK